MCASPGRPMFRYTIFYDTAANLELRGILNREEHSHLLPAEALDQSPPRRRAPNREPISELWKEIVLDLVDDDVIIVEAVKKRVFKDVDDFS
jgi:hypothetical protein